MASSDASSSTVYRSVSAATSDSQQTSATTASYRSALSTLSRLLLIPSTAQQAAQQPRAGGGAEAACLPVHGLGPHRAAAEAQKAGPPAAVPRLDLAGAGLSKQNTTAQPPQRLLPRHDLHNWLHGQSASANDSSSLTFTGASPSRRSERQSSYSSAAAHVEAPRQTEAAWQRNAGRWPALESAARAGRNGHAARGHAAPAALRSRPFVARISPDGSPEPSPVSSPVTHSIADSIRRAEQEAAELPDVVVYGMPKHWDPMPGSALDNMQLVPLPLCQGPGAYGDLEGWQDPQRVGNLQRALRRGEPKHAAACRAAQRVQRAQRDAEVAAVLSFFQRSTALPQERVVSVSRVQNPRLWARFSAMRAEMAAAGVCVTEDWWTVHGWTSSMQEAGWIAEHGLDQRWDALLPSHLPYSAVKCYPKDAGGALDPQQGDDRTQSAVVLCRIMLPSSRSLRERQTFYHNIQRQVRGSSTFSDMPKHFSSDQTYPEYVIQVAE